jgi:hypothetical protein
MFSIVNKTFDFVQDDERYVAQGDTYRYFVQCSAH